MEAIKKSALTELCLAGNEIDDETACLIAHGVKATPSIQNLDLHSNHFGSDTETVETFASLLHSNKTLVHIDLTQCQFTPENFQPIMIAMESTWCLLAV
jgi:Ran GTPase-activating protein (RanGAP) involved in mRNA processing and transport